ncbi:MAG: hypothetical protein ACQEUK_02620 [Pseudomonadota bacterium]
MSAPLPAVANRYRGVWQRTLYAEPATSPYQQADTISRVFWLQGQYWHADLRLPATLPDFSGITCLTSCDHAQLEWLASLSAFAGITQIEGELCTWHRYQDLCPGLERDVGLLRWIDDDTLEERHPTGRYVEHWQRLTSDIPNETVRTDERGQLCWLQLGDYAMAITPRPANIHADTLFTPLNRLADETLRWRASLCFDFLQRTQAGWQVVLSTQPWREGWKYDNGINLPHPSRVIQASLRNPQ